MNLLIPAPMDGGSRCRTRWQTLAARLAALALVPVLAVLVFAACGDDGNSSSANSSGGYRGAIVTPPFEKPDFILTDTSGKPYDIRGQTEGFVTLIYLGYTHCPDVCPTHMANIAQVLSELPADVTRKIKVIMITADPARDTPAVLRKWLDLFDKSFIGLTGPEETIVQVQETLGINPATRTDLGDGNYAVNHAAYVMAFTPADNLAHTVYPLGVTNDDWKHDLTALVREGWKPQ